MWLINTNSIKFSFFIVIIITICFIVSPFIFINQAVFAQNGTGLSQTCEAAGLPCDEAPIATIIGQIIYVILGFLGVIFIILLIYGGFIRMTAQGNPEAIKKSNGIITSAVIGIIIIIASYTITAFILSRVGASVGEGSESGSSGCSSLGGLCHPIAECPGSTMSIGKKDCGSNQACCVDPEVYYP